jgi:hypothetical protein
MDIAASSIEAIDSCHHCFDKIETASSISIHPYSNLAKVIGYHMESERVRIGCCTFLECKQC